MIKLKLKISQLINRWGDIILEIICVQSIDLCTYTWDFVWLNCKKKSIKTQSVSQKIETIKDFKYCSIHNFKSLKMIYWSQLMFFKKRKNSHNVDSFVLNFHAFLPPTDCGI